MFQHYLKPVGQRLLSNPYISVIPFLGPVFGITCFFLGGLYLFNALYVNTNSVEKRSEPKGKQIPVASVDITSGTQEKPLLRVAFVWAEQ